MMLVIFITMILFCSYSSSYVAKKDLDIPEISLVTNFPYLNNFYKQNKPNIVNTFERSGWPKIYDKGIEDYSSAITIDTQGNIIVTGYTGYFENDTEVLDFLTVKYDSEGNELWNTTFDSGTYDYAWDIVSDSEDNIIVLGFNWTTYGDLQNLSIYFQLVKYNKNGVEQWSLSYHIGIDNYPGGITVDSNDCIIINGGYGDLDQIDFSCWTLKLDSDGLELWNQTFNEGIIDIGTDVTVDSNDNVVIGGMSLSFFGQGYSAIKYDSNGNKISVHRFNRGNQPNAIALDSNDNIILTGQAFSQESNSSTWYTLKSGKNGNLLWTREYDSGDTDIAEDVSIDSNGNIITVGWSSFYKKDNYEQCAIIYDKDGKEFCMKRPNIHGFISGVAIDNNDRIIITGTMDKGNNWDYYTNIFFDVTPPSIITTKPEAKALYILNTKLLPLPRNTFIIGQIDININIDNLSDVVKVEFYIDNKLRETLNSPPFEWIWSDRLFGKYNIKTMAYDETGSIAKYELNVWKFF